MKVGFLTIREFDQFRITLNSILESDLEDIIDVISPKLEYLYANINNMKTRYGDLSFSLIIENLFSGLPLPNFMKHHAEGLMGKLSSGFGLFGGTQEKTISDYQKIIFVFAGGLNFNELKSIKRNVMISLPFKKPYPWAPSGVGHLSDKIIICVRLEEICGKNFEIISNSFYNKNEAVHWL